MVCSVCAFHQKRTEFVVQTGRFSSGSLRRRDNMTDEQKQTVSRLRKEGPGYTLIAKKLVLPKSTVSTYCKQVGLSGCAKNTSGRFCPQCGKPVIKNLRGKPRKFCSDECRKLFWKTHPEKIIRKAVYEFTCANCKKTFTAYGNANRKFCSHKCYLAYRFGSRDE